MANLGVSKFTSRIQQQTAILARAIERIHEEENEIYVVRADNISRENDRLRKELYDLQQRINILTERLGFENLDRAEESLNEKLGDVVQKHQAAIARIDTLTSELTSARAQLLQEQASRIEDEQLLESLKSDLARRKQNNLEAQTESELNREALGRLKLELQSEWQKTSKLESTISSLRKDNERLASECGNLKSEAARDRAQRASVAPETPLRGPTSSGRNTPNGAVLENRPNPEAAIDTSSLPLEVQITHLRRQYDELLASKASLSEQYSRDLADWKNFKERLRTSSGGKGIVVSADGLRTQRRVAKQSKDSPTPAKRAANARLAPLNTAGDDVFVKQEDSSSPFMDMLLAPNPKPTRVSSNHVTSKASPAVTNTDTQDSQSLPSAEQAGGSKEPLPLVAATNRTVATRPDITALKLGSQSDDEGNISSRKVNQVPAPLARSLSSPAATPHRPKNTPRSSKLLGKRKAMVFDGENEDFDGPSLPPIEGSPPGPGASDVESREERDARLRALRRKSGPQVLAEYEQYKGRGRYAAGTSKAADKTINSEFEINPAQNDGMQFEFDSVVRNKNDRKKLAAGDCIACKEYYEAVGAMPRRPGAPLWRSPSPEGNTPSRPRPCKHHHKGPTTETPGPSDNELANIGGDTDARKQAISRHRHKWAPASTPPDYWNIGFPDTQQVQDINRRAGELHNQKRDAIEQEASREGGRYRKRA